MDKVMTKRIWSAEGLPTPAWQVVSSVAQRQEAFKVLGAPTIVNPAREGTSLGLTKVTQVDQCEAAARDDVLAQQDLQEGRLPDAGLADDVHVRKAIGLGDADPLLRPMEVRHAEERGLIARVDHRSYCVPASPLMHGGRLTLLEPRGSGNRWVRSCR
jgi:hypothetical protein